MFPKTRQTGNGNQEPPPWVPKTVAGPTGDGDRQGTPSLPELMLRNRPSSDNGREISSMVFSGAGNPWKKWAEAMALLVNPQKTGSMIPSDSGTMRAWLFHIFRRHGVSGAGYGLWAAIEACRSGRRGAAIAGGLIPDFQEIGATVTKKMSPMLPHALANLAANDDHAAIHGISDMASKTHGLSDFATEIVAGFFSDTSLRQEPISGAALARFLVGDSQRWSQGVADDVLGMAMAEMASGRPTIFSCSIVGMSCREPGLAESLAMELDAQGLSDEADALRGQRLLTVATVGKGLSP